LEGGGNFYNELFYRIPGLFQTGTRREQKQYKTYEKNRYPQVAKAFVTLQ
jgi:hypothetical protein